MSKDFYVKKRRLSAIFAGQTADLAVCLSPRKVVIPMDIGAKLKAARIAAHFTQEQAADAIGVSRQTMSNWENSKTYPDIVSVVKLSDLYDISLDRLLKDKEVSPMSDYLNYLVESTDTVASRQKLSIIILLAVYLAIWAFSLLVFWCFTAPDGAMGYSLLFLYLLLPVAAFVVSLLLGCNGIVRRAKWKWLLPLALGLMYMLAEYGTFSLSNMLFNEYSQFHLPHLTMLCKGMLYAAFGLALGLLASKKRKRTEK